jgi:conjugative transposon TraJ protein
MYVGPDGQGDPDRWYTYTHRGSDASEAGLFSGLGEDLKFAMAKASYNFRSSVKQWMSEVLEVLFEAAALCIDTLRTFQLVVLSILGPLVFGLAVFDGFQRSLSAWLARYIHIFLWLPVANIFGAIIGRIQEKMLQIDISQVSQQGDTFFSTTDVAYLIFLIIGIVGYFTVPSVAHYIVEAGQNVLGQKVTTLFHHTPRTAMQLVAGGSVATGNLTRDKSSPPSSSANPYMASRLQGKGS